MFSVNDKNENGFDLLVLNDHASGTSVEIIPACGGILHAFNIVYEQAPLNVIDQYSNKKQFDDRVEDEGFKSCKLSPFACRLKDGKYKFGENEYTIEKFYLGKHALHGLIYDAAFSVVKLDADTEKASAELLFSYKATDKGFPFKYDCRVIYELTKGNTLSITSFIKNMESSAIPITDGWHPYFSFGKPVDELYLSFRTEEVLEFDAALIPTGKIIPNNDFAQLQKIGTTKLDNGFFVAKGEGPALILKDEEKQLQVEISPDKSYPILQIYTPDHRRSIAVENLSGAPDAFNNEIGLTVLRAGKEASFKTTYVIKNLNP